MKKLIIIILLSSNIIAQQYSKVYLKNGNMYVGVIIENNEELQKYVIELKGGSRINIIYSDVKNIEIIPISKNGTIGFNLLGVNGGGGLLHLNHFFNQNVSISLGMDYDYVSLDEPVQTESNTSLTIGARYYFKSFIDDKRSYLSLTYGKVGSTFYDANTSDPQNLKEVSFNNGVRLGAGRQVMFGMKNKHGLNWEICYHLTSERYEWYMDNKDIWTGDSPSRIGWTFGYVYGF